MRSPSEVVEDVVTPNMSSFATDFRQDTDGKMIYAGGPIYFGSRVSNITVGPIKYDLLQHTLEVGNIPEFSRKANMRMLQNGPYGRSQYSDIKFRWHPLSRALQ